MSQRPTPTLSLSDVLFEDAWIVAFHKPAGLPAQSTMDPNRDHMVAAAGRLLSARDGQPIAPVLHHRLDVETSGVMVMAKRAEANRGLTEAFRAHRARKTYLALCGPLDPGAVPDASWSVSNFLGRVAGGRGRVPARYGSVRSGGDAAITEFAPLERPGGALLVEARPRTGRTHQIRVHLAEAGLPILGDVTYGGRRLWRGVEVPRVMLHARALALPHPITGKALEIVAPIAPDMLAVLDALRDVPTRRSPP